MVGLFKNVGERCTAKKYHSVILLSVVSQLFETLITNRLFDFQHGFSSS